MWREPSWKRYIHSKGNLYTLVLGAKLISIIGAGLSGPVLVIGQWDRAAGDVWWRESEWRKID